MLTLSTHLFFHRSIPLISLFLRQLVWYTVACNCMGRTAEPNRTTMNKKRMRLNSSRNLLVVGAVLKDGGKGPGFSSMHILPLRDQISGRNRREEIILFSHWSSFILSLFSSSVHRKLFSLFTISHRYIRNRKKSQYCNTVGKAGID